MSDRAILLWIACAALALPLAIGGAIGWYYAGLQVRVWERQGIHVTRWETFWGCKPAVSLNQPEDAK